MNRKNRQNPSVVFAVYEAAPFLQTGGLGDVGGALPPALSRSGANIAVMLPLFASIPMQIRGQLERIAEFTVPLGWRKQPCTLWRLNREGVQWYFLGNSACFDRENPYGYDDDGERMAFFSRAVCEVIGHLPDFCCDILHCNDWHTALIPVFLRAFYPELKELRTVLTIHNLHFQGRYGREVLGDLLGLEGLPISDALLQDGAVNYLKGGLCLADAITTVSPTYAEEIRTAEYGEGLDWLLRAREKVLYGILNGIADDLNPQTDPILAARYTADDPAGKAICREALQKELGLDGQPGVPIAAMVTRLAAQKGIDLLLETAGRLLSQPIRLVVLGSGRPCYEQALSELHKRFPGRFFYSAAFDPALSRRIYAGADLLLMPSLFEPCGISQMIAMRYGTLPVVRETGGLRDTVLPYNRYTGEGVGFSFVHFTADDFYDAVCRASSLYTDAPQTFSRLREAAMGIDFSWENSAQRYLALYRQLLDR